MSKSEYVQGNVALTEWLPQVSSDGDERVFLMRTFLGPDPTGEGEASLSSNLIPKVVGVAISDDRMVAWLEVYAVPSMGFGEPLDSAYVTGRDGEGYVFTDFAELAVEVNEAVRPYLPLAYEDTITADHVRAAFELHMEWLRANDALEREQEEDDEDDD